MEGVKEIWKDIPRAVAMKDNEQILHHAQRLSNDTTKDIFPKGYYWAQGYIGNKPDSLWKYTPVHTIHGTFLGHECNDKSYMKAYAIGLVDSGRLDTVVEYHTRICRSYRISVTYELLDEVLKAASVHGKTESLVSMFRNSVMWRSKYGRAPKFYRLLSKHLTPAP